jgi:hypothetical protein
VFVPQEELLPDEEIGLYLTLRELRELRESYQF